MANGTNGFTNMSFRRQNNRHDEWVRWRDSHLEEIERTGLPQSIFRGEDNLVRFLSQGRLPGESIDLRAIPDPQFRQLEVVVNAFFHDGWEQSSWAVLAAERLRRFGRYA